MSPQAKQKAILPLKIVIKFKLIISIFLVSSLILSGCASNETAPGYIPQFTTRISQSGLKHFQLSLTPERRHRVVRSDASRLREQNMRNASKAAKKHYRRLERTLKIAVENELEKHQYCRDGHWIIDVELYNPIPFIRGECNEIATLADRSSYPDTIAQW